ncbi:hypothetical protein RUR49_03535 [Pseudoxanthobacter sp. M-2]|uniref:hypothetical protein n=1 Tax=Pseudoxanthobacter sp. M-2 TaxID=3078754 RepID=UPI0038FBF746
MAITKTTRALTTRALAILALGGLAAGCVGGPQDYYDDGTSAQTQEGQPLMHRLLTGAGIVDPPSNSIQYAPRSPIVVPPSTDLRPPESSPGATAGTEWPTNPEEVAAASRAAGQKDPGEVLREAMHSGDRLTSAEVQAGRIPGGGLAGAQAYNTDSTKRTGGERLTQTELQTLKVNSPSSGGPDIGQAPTRKYLIEPPEEYRTPAATAAMPADPTEGKPVNDGIGDPRMANRQIPGVAGN